MRRNLSPTIRLVTYFGLTNCVAAVNFLFCSAGNYRNRTRCLEGYLSLQEISLLQLSGEVVDMIMVEFLEG